MNLEVHLGIYDQPRYYEIAFSFRDLPKEVDFLEKAIARYSKIKVRNVLELASGPSPYLEEWHRRGYRYFGLDKSNEMLEYARRKAARRHIPVRLLQGDMNEFALSGLRVDLAYVLLGSLFVSSTAEFLRHLDCVARVVKSGGLYILDHVVWFRMFENRPENWTISANGIKVRCAVRWKPVEEAAQTVLEQISLDVSKNKTKKRFRENYLRKIFFPQEFLHLVECNGKFAFCGWFNDFDVNKPVSSEGRQVVVLRRT